ncbi:cell wall-binding repeat-containing protein [Cryobacterium sp. CG_9.6]|uniref:cell wall-binding repeat-containing protein n=1 Tax=Cryobacterium sp. CG_9.6 TaxID=2760710 RepID=UPI0024733F7A|nr:cell wall-binding repeat-containing protein [Cryobacterium sp. CG_9.6]MDH6236700.1 surface antigen/putative cell wall-binding protein [Cryobacterium sp. CG_9.6]
MDIHAGPQTPPRPRSPHGLRRALTALLTALVLVASVLVAAPAAYAGTDDYPAKWRDIPIDSVFDTWRMYNRECTSFVAFRLSSRNGFEMPFYNDASRWGADARARGYTVDTTPAVGAVAWWEYGHLAWVEAVNRDGTIVTEEYNWRINGVPDGAYHRRTIKASAPTGYIHYKDAGSPLSPGVFVLYGGHVYRIVGGAPVYVSDWAVFGGPQPLITLSDAQWAKLPQHPADGTFVTAKPSGEVYRVAGGAPIYVSTWATYSGEQPTVAIGDDAIRKAGTPDAAGRWSHLRRYPADGTFVTAKPAGQVYRVDGGAPSPVTDWASVGGVQTTVIIGDDNIQKAGTVDSASRWSHLRARLAGSDRFATSAAISAANFSPGVSVAYVASSTNFPDALSGAPVAAKNSAPVLLVQADNIPSIIQAELSRLKPGRIVVLGGENSVNVTVAEQLATFSPTGNVTRLFGPDRFASSAAISSASFAPGAPVVYVASGLSFPDALSGAPVAATNGAPVLLVQPDAIPTEILTELERLSPTRIVVLGGVNSVNQLVEAQLATLAPQGVTRLHGPDRFATSAAISAATFAPGIPVAYLANGHNFPDALSGAPVAARNGAPVLLVQAGDIPAVIQAELNRLRPTRIIVLGGENSVNSAILP